VTDERRASARFSASLAGELESEQGKSAIAITRDVSSGGLAIFTRLRECSGAVKLRVVHAGEEMILAGTVLRVEVVEDSAIWRTKVAIGIDSSDPVLAKLFAALAAPSS
jgi:hypothetical protein